MGRRFEHPPDPADREPALSLQIGPPPGHMGRVEEETVGVPEFAQRLDALAIVIRETGDRDLLKLYRTLYGLLEASPIEVDLPTPEEVTR